MYCGDCKFEGMMCEWKNFETKNPWTVIKPASGSPGSMPKKDADNRSDGGYVAVKMVFFQGRVVCKFAIFFSTKHSLFFLS